MVAHTRNLCPGRLREEEQGFMDILGYIVSLRLF